MAFPAGLLLEGLCMEWEADGTARKQYREKKRLFTSQTGGCEPSCHVVEAARNQEVLACIARRLGKNKDAEGILPMFTIPQVEHE